ACSPRGEAMLSRWDLKVACPCKTAAKAWHPADMTFPGCYKLVISFMTRPRWALLFVLSLAVAFTLLNAIKPLHIDDTAYYYYARHISQHPLDPYGFEILWYSQPQSANTVLAPPVLPYWLAPAVRCFGEQPFWWKIWLFPFALLF